MNAHTVNQEQLRSNLTNSRHWIRLAYMLIFALLLHLAGLVMWVLCALQFLFALITGKDNGNLRSLGNSIGMFIHQALDFVSYNTEQKPFPFAAWPSNPPAAGNDSNEIIIEPEQVDENQGEGSGNNP